MRATPPPPCYRTSVFTERETPAVAAPRIAIGRTQEKAAERGSALRARLPALPPAALPPKDPHPPL
eukprot:2034882-Prymnesium_polylepis.1